MSLKKTETVISAITRKYSHTTEDLQPMWILGKVLSDKKQLIFGVDKESFVMFWYDPESTEYQLQYRFKQGLPMKECQYLYLRYIDRMEEEE